VRDMNGSVKVLLYVPCTRNLLMSPLLPPTEAALADRRADPG